MNIQELEKKIANCDDMCKNNDIEYKNMIKHIYENDDSEISIEYFLDTLSDNERSYYICNKKYIEFISNYSQAYLDLCEWYVGPYLPYEVFMKYNLKNNSETYLDTKEDIILLYKYFMIASLFEKTMNISLDK